MSLGGVDLEILREQLDQVFTGDLVKDLHYDGKSIDVPRETLDKVILGVERHGDWISFVLSQDWYILFKPASSASFYTQEVNNIRFSIICQGNVLYCVDPNKVVQLKGQYGEVAHAVGHYGPDLLSLDEKDLRLLLFKEWQRAKAVRTWRSIYSVLNNSMILSGLGNVYLNDVLFLCGINPDKPLARLEIGQVGELARQLKLVTNIAVKKGGYGEHLDRYVGEYAPFVYKKTECYNCGTKVRSKSLSGKEVYYCPQCQPIIRQVVVDRG